MAERSVGHEPALASKFLLLVGSRARLAMEIDACLSVNGVQLVPPSCATQTPPLTAPT